MQKLVTVLLHTTVRPKPEHGTVEEHLGDHLRDGWSSRSQPQGTPVDSHMGWPWCWRNDGHNVTH